MAQETETLENPVIREDNIVGSQLRELSQQVDSGAVEADSASLPALHEEKQPETKPEIVQEGAVERQRDATGKFIKTGDQTADTKPIEEVAGDTKPTESEYAKAQRERKEKDQARLDKTWENANAIKEQNALQAHQIAQEKQRLLELSKQTKVKPESDTYFEAAQDFERYADSAWKKFDETGDVQFLDEAKKQNRLFREALAAGGRLKQFEQQEGQKMAMLRFDNEWDRHVEDAFKSDPELTDANSGLAKTVNEFWQNPQIKRRFMTSTSGFKDLVQVAKWKHGSAETDLWRERAEKAEAALTERDKATSLASGGVTAPARSKTFDQMSPDEQSRILRQSASDYDSSS